jgi:Domain of unknown function (DUF4258)
MPTVDPASLSKDQAKAKLNRCLHQGETDYYLTGHCADRIAERDLTNGDVLSVCRSGAVIKPPEWDIKFRNWKYTVEGLNVDGVRISVVFAFVRSRAIFITVFREGH